MEFWTEIPARYLSGNQVQFTFPGLTPEPSAIVEGECYRALQNIKRILEDDSLTDPECFLKTEEIVSVMESLGGSAGSRHVF